MAANRVATDFNLRISFSGRVSCHALHRCWVPVKVLDNQRMSLGSVLWDSRVPTVYFFLFFYLYSLVLFDYSFSFKEHAYLAYI
jgi:hypothetical protein